MFFRFIQYYMPAPQRPMVCAIDMFGLLLQLQLLLHASSQPAVVQIYLMSTVLVFFGSCIYHYAPSESGFTIRFDLMGLYFLIILTILPYWNDHLAFWWVGIQWPTGNLIIIALVTFVIVYLWRPSYRPHKIRHIAIMLGLSLPPSIHMLVGRQALDPEVWWLWSSGIALYVFALIIYALRFEWNRMGFSHYSYYHLLLVPAVYVQSQAVLAYVHP